jgi:hypothetical protein
VIAHTKAFINLRDGITFRHLIEIKIYSPDMSLLTHHRPKIYHMLDFSVAYRCTNELDLVVCLSGVCLYAYFLRKITYIGEYSLIF